MLSSTLWSLGIATLVATLSPVLASPITTQVPTPRGTSPRTNVFEVPAGSRIKHVGTTIRVFAPDGTIVGVVPAAAPASSFPTLTPMPMPTTDAATSFQTGWITFAYWLNPYWNNQTAPPPIGSFTATWEVPPAPATYHGQTVFLFNAIQPATSSTIVQPVLQYGTSNAGGGEYWTVANWYVLNGNAFFTSPVRVSVGQTLYGKVQLLGTEGTTHTYESTFTNIDNTTLTIDSAELFDFASITLEAYGVIEASDYPTGLTRFSDINLKLATGASPDVTWNSVNDDADGLSTTIDMDGSRGAEITITY